MTDKVIEFPKHKVVREVPSDFIEERNRRVEQKTADSIVDDISSIIITELDNYYVDVQTKEFSKDFILIVDSLKAAVYRSFGIDHHLHTFIDNNVTLIDSVNDEMSKEDIKNKIESVMKELSEAKEKLDKEENEE